MVSLSALESILSEGTLFGKQTETKPREGERMQDNHTVAPSYLDILFVFIREALPNSGLTPINLHILFPPRFASVKPVPDIKELKCVPWVGNKTIGLYFKGELQSVLHVLLTVFSQKIRH